MRCSGADARGSDAEVGASSSVPRRDAPIHDIAWTQPALFAVEYALTELWRSWGVTPAAVIGHSVGEYAAACAAGVFTLEDGLRLIAERGRLLQALPPGGMMAALFAPVDDVVAAVAPISDRVAVAAINAPDNVVISGETAAVESLLASFAQRNVQGQRAVRLARRPLAVGGARARRHGGTRPYCANVAHPGYRSRGILTGGALPAGAAPDAVYWRRHMREPVRFAEGIKTLHGRRLPHLPRGWSAPDVACAGAAVAAGTRHPTAHLAAAWQR